MFIYKGEEIKKIDKEAEKSGVNPFALLENAGRALYGEIKAIVQKHQRILVLAGKGNNGGDGIVLARNLQQNGFCCQLAFPIGTPQTESAIDHFQYYKKCGFNASEIVGRYDVIIDALLGIGTKQPLKKNVNQIIQWANRQEAMRLAIDMPTGVSADGGEVEIAFRADQTYSLHGFKPSAFLPGSSEYYGNVTTIDIGLPQDSKWRVWSRDDVKETFPKRIPESHKGTYGNGLLIAGTDEMPGSALLASLAAMRSGIGKLTVATTRFSSSIIAARVPECTFLHDGLNKVAKGYIPSGIKSVAIGPGLDDDQMVEQAIAVLFEQDIPIILDAGALNKRSYPKRTALTIVTPHPGEFSRMTGIRTADIQKNRLDIAADYAKEHGLMVILKGRNTVIAFPDGDLIVNTTGNAGLAKGGTGDTLTGMLLAFLATANDVKSAIANAVYLHGESADLWKETKAERSLLASDVSVGLSAVFKRYEQE